jgi:hypothetical protein
VQEGRTSQQGLILSSKLLFVSFQSWHIIFYSPGKMTISTKLDEKLEGVDNFRAWKYRVMLVLEENGLKGFIEADIPKPEGDEDKPKHKKSLVKAKRIIVDSIKDHLIPHVSSLKTPKKMFDALSRLYEGKNVNKKMALRTQPKKVKMQDSESIQSYFTRVSQIIE